MNLINHTIDPVYNSESQILILGTMPSPKSREAGFYYSHPQNRFWRIAADVLSQTTPLTKEEKLQFLYRNHIAMWDVLKSCVISGAQDSSIKNPVVNEIGRILKAVPIKAVFTTGNKATELYRKYCFPETNREPIYLPSTSPANCGRYTYHDLLKAYARILDYLS